MHLRVDSAVVLESRGFVFVRAQGKNRKGNKLVSPILSFFFLTKGAKKRPKKSSKLYIYLKDLLSFFPPNNLAHFCFFFVFRRHL